MTILDAETTALRHGVTLLAFVPYPHEDDRKFLALVICETPGKYHPFVCWTYNATDDGFHNGQYNETYMGAIMDLHDRLGKLRT